MGAALVAAGAMTLVLTWHLTFFQDTWEFLINRRGFTVDSFLQPHNEHLVVFPVAIQQLFLHLFGMTSARPEYILFVAFLLVTDFLVFVYVRRRVGQWLALFAAVLILCLGPAWELLLWPFEITLVGSVLFGLAMLLALERDDRYGDAVASACLLLSLGFSSVGVPFAVAAIAAVALSPPKRRRQRGVAMAIPILLYVAWYIGWGHDAETHLSVHNVLASPRFVAETLAVGVGNLFGLGASSASGGTDTTWGCVLLVLIAALLIAYKRLRPGIPTTFWPLAIAAVVNWFLTAFNEMPGRDPTSSRYQYATCILLLLMAANLLQGMRVSRRIILLGGAVTLLAIGPNLVVLKDGRDFFADQTVFTRSDTAAIEIARRTVSPGFELAPGFSGTGSLINIFAGPYLEAVDEYGSPAYTQAELASAPAEGRRAADVVLSQALALKTVTRPETYDFGALPENCVALLDSEREVRLDPGQTRIEVAPGPEAHLSLRRFATGEFPVQLAPLPGESTTALTIPRDESPRPWYLHVEAEQAVRVCR
jgi:hypothetical protein